MGVDEDAPTGGYLVENVDGIGDWVIEEFEGLDNDVCHHMTAFFANLTAWHRNRGHTMIILTKADYKERVTFIQYLLDGGDCRLAYVSRTFMA